MRLSPGALVLDPSFVLFIFCTVDHKLNAPVIIKMARKGSCFGPPLEFFWNPEQCSPAGLSATMAALSVIRRGSRQS